MTNTTEDRAGTYKHLLTVDEVAQALGMTKKGVYRLTKKGALVHVNIGSRIRFCTADVDNFILQMRRSGR